LDPHALIELMVLLLRLHQSVNPMPGLRVRANRVRSCPSLGYRQGRASSARSPAAM